MLFKLFFLVCILPVLKCSLVIDSGKQQGIYLNNYCPAMKYCPEGAHVMCMYYNPHQVLGPRCSNALNLSITPDLADTILDLSNAIRSRIARGKEKGKDGKYLPRGYGIFKLKWDSELATFAQVLSNQCVLRHDMCRATKRFPNPGQTAGLLRFTYPDWFLLSKSANFTTPGFHRDKLQYAVMHVMKKWYMNKNSVSKDMIVTYPDWTKNPNNQQGRLYLETIYGPATHMGCGVSAYTEYKYYDNNADITYNSVQIVCNYSARPNNGEAVYNTVPPSDTEIPPSNCGCPIGSYSDQECLCQYHSERDMLTTKTRSCNGASCEPTVVLLPIFTTEDTSPEHIFNSLTNMSKAMQGSLEIEDITNIMPNNYLRMQNKNKQNVNTKKRFTVVHNTQSNYITSIKNRHSDEKYYDTEPSKDRYIQTRRPIEKHVPKKISSIFGRVTRFALPTKHSKSRDYNTIKRDVFPRKDFSDAKILVDKYVHGSNNLFKPKTNDDLHYEEPSDMHRVRTEMFKHSKENLLELKDILPHKTEATLNQAEQRIIHHNEYENDLQKESIYNEPIDSVTLQTDNKLMSLLDTLEKEVKDIELQDKDKEIFDKKIRKIYGKIVGKPVGSLKHDSDITKPIKAHNSQSKSGHSIFNVEEILRKHESHNNNNIHKSFEQYDEPTTIEQHIQKKLRDRNMYRNDDETKLYRTKTSYRDIDHNEIISQEHKYDDLDYNNYRKNDFKDRYSRRSSSRIENLDEHRNLHYLSHDKARDPLSIERRKYYQEKLDNMERRLNRARNYKRHRVPEERHMRAMLPHSTRKSETKMEPFYIPDRARFLHGY